MCEPCCKQVEAILVNCVFYHPEKLQSFRERCGYLCIIATTRDIQP